MNSLFICRISSMQIAVANCKTVFKLVIPNE